METLKKAKIDKTDYCDFPYNVQIWQSIDYGKNWYYCGWGRFCKTLEEANNFAYKALNQ